MLANKISIYLSIYLHCALAVCLWLCGCVFVGGSVTTITRNCVHRSSQTGCVVKGSDHLQLIKFWPSCAPGKGVCGGAKIFGSALLQPARTVCISLSTFFIWEEIWILSASLLTAACDVTAVEPISGGLICMEAFWSKPSVKSWDKNHIRGGKNLWSTVIWGVI